MTAADRPRVGDTITTAAQVRALPHGTVVRTHNGILCETQGVGLATPSWYAQGRMLEAQHLPARVLYVPHEPTATPADLTVTDDARAEAVRKVLHDETGGCTCSPSYTERGLEAPDCPWHDIERAIPAVLNAAAGRAETAEDAAWEVIARVRDAHPRVNNDAPTDEIVAALADVGLLATARTLPTREQVAAAIGDAANSTQVGFGVVSITAAVDAVLALLGGDDK